ncbi:MAG: hypothetical protein ACWGOX_15125, partial [Desulforhopalus sp.]
TEQWTTCRVIESEVRRIHPLYPGQVMFPTTHDIVPENLEACLTVLANLLDAGNRVLVVSKPNLACIRHLCRELQHFRKQLLFRFTVTARDKNLLAFWEPGAPGYGERKECLKYTFAGGFATSVSVEPMLDTADVVGMVRELLPYTSHSIWLGKMNRIKERVVVDSVATRLAVDKIRQGQVDERLKDLFNHLGYLKKVRWKESIKQVVGIEPPKGPGLDI